MACIQGFTPVPLVCVDVSHLSHAQVFVTPWTGPPGSPVHGILQARILQWVAISFSRRSSNFDVGSYNLDIDVFCVCVFLNLNEYLFNTDFIK